MKSIIPHLWFDQEAREASEFYVSLFEGSMIERADIIKDTPSGDAEIISFILAGQSFMSISAGPFFKFNPSVSLMVNCYSKAEIDKLWNALSKDGSELMPLGEYPFSPYYSWVQDKFGLSWQLFLTEQDDHTPKIVPNLLFSNGVCGRTEEAVNFYVDVFKHAGIHFVSRYGEGETTNDKAKINFIAFSLENTPITAMDNGYEVDFTFNEAFSFVLSCDDQDEIDYYWQKLSAVPEAEQCGWVKDQFGFSWQIMPYNMAELMQSDSEEVARNTTQAMLQMKKIDIEALKSARLK